MRKPKMILFDYGHTLAYEPDTDFIRGEEAVFRHVTENPQGVTPWQASRLGTEIWLAQRQTRHAGWEQHEHQQLRLKYDSLGLKFDLPMGDLEKLLWTATTPGAAMPGAAEMLAELEQRGIRTGVISNLGWSADALADRLKRLLGHEFEFVMTSSEYGARKPDSLLFRAALSRAGLDAGDVWFCGDEIRADIHGAQSVGMFPVWYQDETIPNGFTHKNEGLAVEGEHLRIRRWTELTQAIDDCEE
ncbi:MAG: HAD family hydrolase [Clostridiales bacterium]|nr:HAD family hydrolase [Clostridiales bacterium]